MMVTGKFPIVQWKEIPILSENLRFKNYRNANDLFN